MKAMGVNANPDEMLIIAEYDFALKCGMRSPHK
jgi:hypothetical protein